MTSAPGMRSVPTHLRFPPGRRNILVPLAPARAAALGMTMYTASRPGTLAAQRLIWLAARGGAVRALPGPRETWDPPMGVDTFTALVKQWSVVDPQLSVDGVAVYHRVQRFRGGGLVLVVCAGRRSLLVRLAEDPSRFELEARISAAAENGLPDAFRVPRLLSRGNLDDWHWVAYELIARRPHAPVRAASDALTSAVSTLVESVIERPADVPEHWRGAHGDLAPWNLRRGSRRVWLIDWEDARWAPPGADLVYHAATSAAITRRPARPIWPQGEWDEARAHWGDLLRARRASEHDAKLIADLLVILGDRQPDRSEQVRK